MTDLLVTIFLGWLGIHKFIQGKPKMGVLYMFTGGLCGIGWIVDIIIAASKLSQKPKTYKTSNNGKLDYFPIAGISYRTDDVKTIMKKGNPNYSDFVYRIKEDYVILRPEPSNPHDSNAIAIYMNDVKIGYVPAELTFRVKPLINKCSFIGTIRGGDIRGESGIIKRDFSGEVKIER
ncbi:MAG: NINE protein [Prevotellaceae bacterium]|nr:NINE protein [Candidatus Faecinaster equi]